MLIIPLIFYLLQVIINIHKMILNIVGPAETVSRFCYSPIGSYQKFIWVGSFTQLRSWRSSLSGYFFKCYYWLNTVYGSFLDVFRQKKCSSWFLNVIILHIVHWFQNCAQLNQSIRANIPVSSLADCQLLESYQPMRNQDALDIMLWFNQAQFRNQWTKCMMISLRNQLEHFFCLNTSRKDPWLGKEN